MGMENFDLICGRETGGKVSTGWGEKIMPEPGNLINGAS